MKKLLFVFLLLSSFFQYSYGQAKYTVIVNSDYAGDFEDKIKRVDKYKIDSLIIKGDLEYSDFPILLDCIENGRLRGIDMYETNLESLPPYAFVPSKVNKAKAGTKKIPEDCLTQLEYITLPMNLRWISERAFSMTALRCIELPRLNSIHSGAFENCPNLKSVKIHQALPPTVGNAYVFGGVPSEAVLYVPQGTAETYRNTPGFFNFNNVVEQPDLYVVKTFNIDGNTQSLESMLGDDMLKVDSIALTGYITHNDLKTLRINVCFGRLTGIDLSGCRVENDELPTAAFYSYKDEPYSHVDKSDSRYPKNLRYIKFPLGLKSIGVGSFRRVRLLSLELPSTLETFGAECFHYAEITGDLVIPEGVKHMGMKAFYGAWVNGNIYLPSTLESIGENSLQLNSWDHKGQNINFYCNRMTPPSIGKDDNLNDNGPFVYDSDILTVYVPVGAKAAFAKDEFWGAARIVEIDKLDGGVTAISTVTKDTGSNIATRIYTLDGRYVGSAVDRLGKGVYVVNGKKIVK